MDGTCTDPAFPFCDVNGKVEGQNQTCIAVECEAGEFQACRDGFAITCNQIGTDFDLIQCERGCDEGVGCRLCDPNETACTNGTVATCDAAGVVTSSESCPLGCFEDEPRCRDIDPSNGFAQFLDMVADPPDVDFSGGASIDTLTGQINSGTGTPSFLVAAPTGGIAVRVFVVRSIRLGNIAIPPTTPTMGGVPALAIVASGDISVEGTIDLGGGEVPIAGSVVLASCLGGPGNNDNIGGNQQQTGSGGGGHATAGAPGGNIESTLLIGGAGGAASGTETLIPLRGGCSSGDQVISGGGAIQLSSRTKIIVTGTINVRGGLGFTDTDSIWGGGAGGGILLEAPVVELAGSSKLLAGGGGGGSGETFAMAAESTPSLGATCSSMFCGVGGNGAAVGIEATPGGAPPMFLSSQPRTTSGGGGGGLGRIRINTPTGEFTKSSSTIEAGALTAGTIGTR